MNCQEVLERLSAWIDQDVDPSERAQLQQHLSLCSSCSHVCEDLTFIRHSAGNLNALEPPKRVWVELRTRLSEEGLIRRSHKPRFWEKLFPLGLVSGLKPALAGAIVTLIVVGMLYFLYPKLDGRSTPSPAPSDALALQQVHDAEAHYLQAIQALSDASQKKLESLDPAVAQILNDNLATMDYYVKECKEAIQTNPDNPLVHRYLLAAYQKKVELMHSIVNSDSL